MNTKGTRFLAILAVLAMAFAGFAVFADASQSDAVAAPVTNTITVSGAADDGTGNVTNEMIGNMIDAQYSDSTNTVYLTGVLSKIVETEEVTAGSDAAKAKTIWDTYFGISSVNNKYHHMIVVEVTTPNQIWYEDLYDNDSNASVAYGGVWYKTLLPAQIADNKAHLVFLIKGTTGTIDIYLDGAEEANQGLDNATKYTIAYDFTLSTKVLADKVANVNTGFVNKTGVSTLDFTAEKTSETAVPQGTFGDVNIAETAAGGVYIDNTDLGNNIRISYDAATKTYKVTGTLAYLDPKYTVSSKVYTGLTDGNEYELAAVLMDYGNLADGKYTLGTKHWAIVFDEESNLVPEKLYLVSSTGDYIQMNNKGFTLYLDSSTINNRVISFGSAGTADASGFTYHIDLTELTLSESASKNPENPYVMVDDRVIELVEPTSGYDIDGGFWEYDGTTLKFTNYNGTEAFTTTVDGDDLVVTLEGDNCITLTRTSTAIYADGDLEIKSRSTGGDGTLTIDMGNDIMAIQAIASDKNVGINYVKLDINVDRAVENSLINGAVGISAGEIVSIYHSKVSIDIEEQQEIHDGFYAGIAAMHEEKGQIGITGGSEVSVSAAFGMIATTLNVATSSIVADGFHAGIAATNASFADNSAVMAKASGDYEIDEVGFGLFFGAGDVEIESGSTILADSLYSRADITVNASFTVNDAMILDDFTNGPLGKTMFVGAVVLAGNAVLTNASDDAKESFMNSEGIITAAKVEDKTGQAVIFNQIMPTATWTGNDYFAEAKIIDVHMLVNGDAVVKADITLYSATHAEENVYDTTDIKTIKNVYGTAKVDKDGNLESVAFSIDSENYKVGGDYKTETLNITITKKVDGTAVSYDITTDGAYFVPAAQEYQRQTFADAKATATPHADAASGAAIAANVIIASVTGTSCITVTSGTFTSTGTVYLVNDCDDLINGDTAKFNGDVTADGDLELFKGEMNGNIVINKDATLSIAADAKVTGDVATKGNVTVAGKLTGDVDIQAAIELDVTGSLKGDITTESVNTLKLKSFEGVIKYSGKYWSSAAAQSAAKPGDEPDLTFANYIEAKIVGDDSEKTIIKTIASAVATPGVFQIDDIGKVKKDKTSVLEIVEGELKFTTSMEVDADFVVRANASLPGTIVSIMGKSTKISVSGSFEVQDGVTLNVYEVDKKYGTIDTEINYNYSGYTYYCGLNYALKNAPEGITINVQKNATGLTGEIAVKKDVVINVNTYTIEFDKNTLLTMGEGAYFNLDTGAAVKFKKSAADTTEKKYNVSGVFVMDGSSVTFEQVKFTKDSEVKAADKLTVTAGFDRGTVTAVSGDIAGALVMDCYQTNPEEAGADPVYAAGKFEIGLLSTYYGSVTTDEQCKAKVIINGTFVIDNAKSFMKHGTETANYVEIPVIGLGNFGLTDGQSIKFAPYAAAKLNEQNITVSYGDNAVVLLGVKVLLDNEIKAVKATSTKPAYIGFNGEYNDGSVTFMGNAAIDGNTHVHVTDTTTAEMIVYEGATLSIQSGKTLKAFGLVEVAGTINYKTETVTDYGTLDYQVTYDDAPYTVYTYLSAASENAPAGTVINVDDNLTLTKNTTFSEDITIVIAEDKYIELKQNGYLVIGSGDSLLGALASVSGNIVLNGALSYVLDFVGSGSDVTVWTDKNMTDLAEDTGIITQENYYAVVYTTTDAAKFKELPSLSTLAKPKIDGYYFGSWVLQNGEKVDDDTMMSDGPFIATLVPAKLSVTFAVVEGVQYFYNNMPVSAPGVTLQLDYDTQITAKALDGYQGLPLINGKSVYYVHESGVVTATGVTPIPEPPQPEPEPVVGDSGISLTDILLIILVVLIAVMVIILVLRLNRS